jgi:acetyl esterase/lipase
MIILATIFSGLSLLLSILFLIQLKVINSIYFAKLAAGAFSSIWAIMGAVGALIGWVYGALWALPMGILGAGMMVWYIWQCTRDHNGFEEAFGSGWEDQIPPQRAKRMVKRRWSWFLKMKSSPEPIWERDFPFWTIPGTDRQLLCDLWRPGDGDVSGLAFVYFHGGGWTAMDKDFGTRPFFRHLVAQGHTVMDVAYRLCPEVDIYGIIGDVKRAIAWMKVNASRYGINPEQVVLGGGSAGAHLALLAAYTPGHPELTPEDIKDADLSVQGVISYYGPTDLVVGYKPWLTSNPNINMDPVPIGTRLDSSEAMRYLGRLDLLLGGGPQEVPDIYQLVNPTTHVHPSCPPTLLIQGDKDVLVALDTTCALYTKLVQSGVPAINVVFPWTEHGFDVFFPPQINPAAQSALYDVDRFLALLLNKG